MSNHNKRGLVVTPRFEFDGTSFRFPGLVGLAASDLRRYLLYWDQLDYPNNNIIAIANTPDIDFLMSAGVLSRTQVNLTGTSNFGLAYVTAQMAVFEERNRAEPGAWSLGQTTPIFFAPPNSAVPMRVVEIELTSALPVPSDETSLADVLEFKERRNAELIAFRSAMDELYFSIVNSRDIPRAKDAAILKLERTLADLQVVTNEGWVSRIARSMKIELNIPEVAGTALAGAAFALTLGALPTVGAAVGALAAALKIDITELRAPRLPEDLRDFAYVFHAQTDLGAA